MIETIKPAIASSKARWKRHGCAINSTSNQ